MSEKEMFIVWVSHDTTHGLGTNVCLLTGDFAKALRTCRNIESLGYRFDTDEACMSIHVFEPEKVYRRNDFNMHDVHPLIVSFEKVDGKWKEIWIKKGYNR